MIATLSSSRSAIALNWTASSVSSDEPARTSARSTRFARSPSASAREASVRRRSGVVNRRAIAAATMIASPSATMPTAASRPVTLAMAVSRNVYGFDSWTSMAYGKALSVDVAPVRVRPWSGSRVWPSPRLPVELGVERPVGRPARSRPRRPPATTEDDLDVGLGEGSARTLRWSSSCGDDGGIEPFVSRRRPVAAGRRGSAGDADRRTPATIAGARPQLGLLLAA